MTAATKWQKILPFAIISVAALFYCYEYLLRIMPSTMSKELMAAYQLTANGLGRLSFYYYVAYIPMQLFVGPLFDRFSSRHLMALAVMSCVAGTLIFAANFDATAANIARLLIGFGASFAFVGALKLANHWLPKNYFALNTGMISSLGMLGAILGDLLMVKMVQTSGWQATAYWAGSIGLALTILIYVIIPKAPNQSSTPQHQPASNLRNITKMTAPLLKSPKFWLAGAIGAVLYLSLSAFAELWSIPYLETSYQLSAMRAAHVTTYVFLGWAIGGPLVGFIHNRLCIKSYLLIMIATVGSFASITTVLYWPHLPIALLYPLLFSFGLFSAAEILVFDIGCRLADPRVSGTVIALVNIMVMASSIAQWIIGYLLDLHWSGTMRGSIRIYTAHDYRLALSILPIAMLIALVLAWFLKKQEC